MFTLGFVLVVVSVVLGLLTGDPASVARVRDAIKFLEGLAKAASAKVEAKSFLPFRGNKFVRVKGSLSIYYFTYMGVRMTKKLLA